MARKTIQPPTIVGAVETGKLADQLKALALKLAAAMDDAEPTMVPQIAGQLRSTLVALDGLAPPEGKSASDELTERRQARRAAAKAAAFAAGSGV